MSGGNTTKIKTIIACTFLEQIWNDSFQTCATNVQKN